MAYGLYLFVGFFCLLTLSMLAAHLVFGFVTTTHLSIWQYRGQCKLKANGGVTRTGLWQVVQTAIVVCESTSLLSLL